MNQQRLDVLTEMRVLATEVEAQIVVVWRGMDMLLAATNEGVPEAITYAGTSLIRDALLEAKIKQSEALEVFSPVADLLRLITEDDADAVV